MIGRREFITLLGGAAAPSLLRPLAARAQQVSVVGFLGSASPETYSAFLTALRQGLSDAGLVELRNYRIEFAGRSINSTGCLRSRPSSSDKNRLSSSLPAAFSLRSRPSLQPPRSPLCSRPSAIRSTSASS